MKILIFGNILIEKDNLALRLIPALKREFPDIEFKEFDSVEDLQKEGKNLKIIDAIDGLNEVKLIKLSSLKDYNKILVNKPYSMHDFDLGYNLKLLKKIKIIDKVEIIGIPANISEKQALNQVQLILRKWVAQLMQGS